MFIGIGGASADTAEPIGEAVHVVNLVTAELSRDTRSLRIGDEVRQDELIEVGSDGTGELLLNDDTKIALGPGSRLLLDKFVYDSDRKGAVFINFVKGTLRFVTGLAEKPAYVIRVPSASITVRGTIFDVFTEANGTSWLLLQEGGVRICTDGGTCREHNEPGKLVRITAADVGAPAKWSELPGVEKISFDAAFPFVVEPPTINRKPRFKRDDIIKGLGIPASLPAVVPKPPAPDKPAPKKPEKQRDAKQEEKSDRQSKKSDDGDDDDDEDKSGRDHKQKKSLLERLRGDNGDGHGADRSSKHGKKKMAGNGSKRGLFGGND